MEAKDLIKIISDFILRAYWEKGVNRGWRHIKVLILKLRLTRRG